jgi:hypothetical protein
MALVHSGAVHSGALVHSGAIHSGAYLIWRMFIPAHVHLGAPVQIGAVHSCALVQTGAVHSGALVPNIKIPLI